MEVEGGVVTTGLEVEGGGLEMEGGMVTTGLEMDSDTMTADLEAG